MARPNWEYIRVDVLMPSNPKVCAVPRSSRWLLVEFWCYCGQHLTDGFVPDEIWRATGRTRERQPLIDQGFAERVTGGYLMHDYLGHQRSRADAQALRETRRSAGKKGGSAAAKARAKPAGSQREANEKPDGSHNSSQRDAMAEATPKPDSGASFHVTGPAELANAKQVLQQLPSKRSSKHVAEAEAEAEAEADLLVADVSDQSSRRNPRDGGDLIDIAISEIRKATGKTVTPEWAEEVAASLLENRDVSDPAAYIRSAIQNERDPNTRFLPIAASLPSAQTVSDAVMAAGITPNGKPARGSTVTSIAAQARQAIAKGPAHE